MNKVSYCDFMDAIRAWDVQKVNSLISMVLQSRKPLSDYTYPTLCESVNALYAHFTEYGTQKNFAANYWQTLPDEAYKILEHMDMFYGAEENEVPAHKHFLYEAVMHGDLKMLEFLFEKVKSSKCQYWKLPVAKLLYLGILDFCYMRLPTWQGLPEYKENADELFRLDLREFATDAFVPDSCEFATDAFVLDLRSPDLMSILFEQARNCNVPVPEHLEFLMKHCDMNELYGFGKIILQACDPHLALHISHDSDYGVKKRCWAVSDSRIRHKYQCAEELVKSCIADGEYWGMTCVCGIPECANVNRPILAMRYGNIVRWRITDSDDEAVPDVYYLAIPAKQYLQDMDFILKTIENGIKADGVIPGDSFYHNHKIAFIPSTDEGLKKVRKIRTVIKKARISCMSM